MKEFKISLDSFYQEVKPDNDRAAQIKDRIGSNIITIGRHNLDLVIRKISSLGFSFCPATFRDGIHSIGSFEQMRLFILEIHGLSLEDACRRAEEYNLSILFCYRTNNSTDDKEVSRLGFLVDVSITDTRIAELYLNLLLTIFPEADRSSKDITKIYHGDYHTSSLYIDEKMRTVDIGKLFEVMTLYLRDRYGDINYKRHIKQFARSNGLKLNKKNLIDISTCEDLLDLIDNHISKMNRSETLIITDDKNSPSSIIIYII